jgi:hypothetical protein
MKACTFVYRCRLCGEEFGGLVGGTRVCEAAIIQLTIDPGKLASSPMGMAVGMFDPHHCEDGSMGIGDLQGARALPEEDDGGVQG